MQAEHILALVRILLEPEAQCQPGLWPQLCQISRDPDFSSSLDRCLKPPCCWSLGPDRGAGVCTSRVVEVLSKLHNCGSAVGFACEGTLCCKAHWVFLKFFSGGFQPSTCVILPTASVGHVLLGDWDPSECLKLGGNHDSLSERLSQGLLDTLSFSANVLTLCSLSPLPSSVYLYHESDAVSGNEAQSQFPYLSASSHTP